jgi:hypothetical protein
VDDSSKAYLPGGFLGVNANIISGLLWLSVVLLELKVMKPRFISDVFIQAGGDDFAVILTTKNECRGDAIAYVRRQIRDYVGYIKELYSYDLVEEPGGLVRDAVFCRKRIFLEKRSVDGALRIKSELAIPIPVSLVDQPPPAPDKQQQRWNELDSALVQYELQEPGKIAATGTLRFLFLERHPHAKPIRVRRINRITPEWDVIMEGGSLYTKSAIEAIGRVYPIMGSVHQYLMDFGSRTQFALYSDTVQRREVWFQGKSTPIYLVKSEARRLGASAEKIIEHVGYRVDVALQVLLTKPI